MHEKFGILWVMHMTDRWQVSSRDYAREKASTEQILMAASYIIANLINMSPILFSIIYTLPDNRHDYLVLLTANITKSKPNCITRATYLSGEPKSY